jgi:hypothetical protein
MISKTLKLITIFSTIVILIVNLTYGFLLFRSDIGTIYLQSDNSDNINQLLSIKSQLINGKPSQMQALFPEGEFFSYALYGYSWINIGLESNNEQIIKQAIDESEWVLSIIEKDDIKKVFDNLNMEIEYGIFYQGWYNRLLSGIIGLYKIIAMPIPDTLIDKSKSTSRKIISSLDQSRLPFLEAYPKQVWPCDTIVAISSLMISDKYLDTDYKNEIVNFWLEYVLDYLETNSLELLPHKVDYQGNSILDMPRATSSSYILMFLKDIDIDFANEYYATFQTSFSGELFGYELVREYPHGIEGQSDVDTGPMIFGFAATPTVVSAGLGRIYNDYESYSKLLTLQELLGMQINNKYFFGQLVIFDLFNIWTKTATCWTNSNDYSQTNFSSQNWKSQQILIILAPSLVIIFINIVFILKINKLKLS